MRKMKEPTELPILHRLTADEYRLIQHYRICNATHQQNVRLFTYTAADLTAEETPCLLLPFAAK